MNLKPLIAFFLLVLAILSSIGYSGRGCTQANFVTELKPASPTAHSIADTQKSFYDYRETFKSIVPADLKNTSFTIIHTASQSLFQLVIITQYASFLQRRPHFKPQDELFLDCKSLII